MSETTNATETESKSPKTSEELDMGDLDAIKKALDDPDFIWVF